MIILHKEWWISHPRDNHVLKITRIFIKLFGNFDECSKIKPKSISDERKLKQKVRSAIIPQKFEVSKNTLTHLKLDVIFYAVKLCLFGIAPANKTLGQKL